MSKHTPGPWEIDNGIISQSNGAAYVAEIRRNKFCENSEANNRLIAAAPDLLATLQAVVEAIENSEAGWNGLSIWQEDVHAVIAKATGE